MHVPCGIRTQNPSKRSAADPCLRPSGHWDRQISDNITKEIYQLRIRCFQIISSLIPQAVTVLCNSLRQFACLATSAGVSCPSLFPPTRCSQGPWDLMTSQARLWTRTPSPARGTMANVSLSLSLLLVGWHAWDTLHVSYLQILSRSGVCQGDKKSWGW